MIEYIEELHKMIKEKDYDRRRLTTLNALIECRFINVDLEFLLRSLSHGDEEDIEFCRQILRRTIQKVLEGKYGCR